MERAINAILPSKGSTVVKAELGTKRTCPSCAARFYDLLKNPIVCPKCNANFVAASVLPSKGDMPAMAPAPKPREVEAMFDLAHHFRRVDAIFRRVFASRPKARRPARRRVRPA